MGKERKREGKSDPLKFVTGREYNLPEFPFFLSFRSNYAVGEVSAIS